jgi:hypothetical protein
VNEFEKVGLLVLGAAFFLLMLGTRMTQAGIAPVWLKRFLLPPSRN